MIFVLNLKGKILKSIFSVLISLKHTEYTFKIISFYTHFLFYHFNKHPLLF